MKRKQYGTIGAIIAGGNSSRMNSNGVIGDKFLLRLGECSIIEMVARRMAAQLDVLFINANGDPKRLKSLDLPVLADLDTAHKGPLAGLLTALSYASDYRFLLTAPADCPFLPLDLHSKLLERQNETGADIVLARSNERIHPISGLWSTALKANLSQWLMSSTRASVLSFAEQIGFETVNFPLVSLSEPSTTYDPFFNINFPDDLAMARQINEALQWN